MILPFRALRLTPSHLCVDPSCVSRVLDEPLVVRVPVSDVIGIEYAFDLEVTQGFYLSVVTFVVLRWLRDRALQQPRKRK